MPSLPVDTATEGRGSIKQRLDKIDAAIAYLRTATTTVGRAAIDAGKSLLLSGGGGIDVANGYLSFFDNQGRLRANFRSGRTASNQNNGANIGFYAPDGAVSMVIGSLFNLDNSVYAGEGIGINRGTDGVMRIGANNGTDYMWLRDETGQGRFRASLAGLNLHDANGVLGVQLLTTGDVKLPNLPTSSAAANLTVDAFSGTVSRSTSSRRYKQDIKTADIKTVDVLALVPRAFRTKAEVAELGDAAPVRAGFIAEEAYDAGLHWWVRCDDQGPESFDYASFSVAQQAVIREQQTAIEKLQKQVAALSKKLGL